jgi:restriction endonuclease
LLGEIPVKPVATRAGCVDEDEVCGFRWHLADQLIEVTWTRADGPKVHDRIATHKRLQFDQLDHLTGPEFEQRLAILFRHQGYSVELTKGSGDRGADLLLSMGNIRIAVQAKRYTARVGNGAIQELLGGMVFYNCSRGMVVTTSEFTRSAKELEAKTNGVDLWGRSELRAHFMRAFPYDPPVFSWDAYRRLRQYL